MAIRLQLDRERLVDFCRRHHIRKLSFFGSVLRDDFGPDSDVDVLVEFEGGRTPGMAFFTLDEELSAILGRKVDLTTAKGLILPVRVRVLPQAEVVYERAG